MSGNYDSRGIRRHSWDCLFKLGARWEGLKCYSRPSGWSPKAKKNISNWKPSFLWIQMFYTALPKDSKLLSRPLQTSNFLKSAGPTEMPSSCRSYIYHHRKTRVLPIYSRSFTHNICDNCVNKTDKNIGSYKINCKFVISVRLICNNKHILTITL